MMIFTVYLKLEIKTQHGWVSLFEMEQSEIVQILTNKIDIMTFGLLLPKLLKSDDDKELTETGTYTIIASDWNIYYYY